MKSVWRQLDADFESSDNDDDQRADQSQQQRTSHRSNNNNDDDDSDDLLASLGLTDGATSKQPARPAKQSPVLLRHESSAVPTGAITSTATVTPHSVARSADLESPAAAALTPPVFGRRARALKSSSGPSAVAAPSSVSVAPPPSVNSGTNDGADIWSFVMSGAPVPTAAAKQTIRDQVSEQVTQPPPPSRPSPPAVETVSTSTEGPKPMSDETQLDRRESLMLLHAPLPRQSPPDVIAPLPRQSPPDPISPPRKTETLPPPASIVIPPQLDTTALTTELTSIFTTIADEKINGPVHAALNSLQTALTDESRACMDKLTGELISQVGDDLRTNSSHITTHMDAMGDKIAGLAQSLVTCREDLLTEERTSWTAIFHAWTEHKEAFQQAWVDGKALISAEQEQLSRQRQQFEAEKLEWDRRHRAQLDELDRERDRLQQLARHQAAEHEQMARQLDLDQKHWQREKQRVRDDIDSLLKQHNELQSGCLQLERQIASAENDLVRLHHKASECRNFEAGSTRHEVELRQLVGQTIKREDEVNRMMEEARSAREEAMKMRSLAADDRRHVQEELARLERTRLQLLKESIRHADTAARHPSMSRTSHHQSRSKSALSCATDRPLRKHVKKASAAVAGSELATVMTPLAELDRNFLDDVHHHVLINPLHRVGSE